MPVSVSIVLIAAMARNRTIGRTGGLPWRLPSDLKRFKTLTLGRPIVMGRKTYESIGRPLPGRPVVVVSRNPEFRPLGVAVRPTLDEGLIEAARLALEGGGTRVYVAGGADVYAQALPIADMMVLTEVDADAEGDALFPVFDPAEWETLESSGPFLEPGDEISYRMSVFRRNSI